MYLLDTNVVSELRKVKSGKADSNLVSWAQGISAIIVCFRRERIGFCV
jgi:predicted nucleic acid-binding protein